ncbi:amidohydrolase/deacetylase family metallohydrolase [Pseudogracilibacillus sp. SE30717A]|uniref:amidohydrolase/deacetylase family metallohydrolase n=1 Tax=Pseudogracilibacillus sp. SE30717A TaxID=3098293 RepID=UPI00300E430E
MIQIIKNARLSNDQKVDIIIKNGKILDVVSDWTGLGEIIQLPKNVYVSSGWIDLHTHSYPKYKPYCAYPDDIGFKTGVTTVVDAGSCGANDIDEFYFLSKKCITRVYSFLNVSSVGLKIRNELADMSMLSLEAVLQANEKYSTFIVGLKARVSASVVGENGTLPLEVAKKFSKQINKPLMVHIGSTPPKLVDIVSLLEPGDIITHCYNEKINNHIFSDNGLTKNSIKEAIERGVYLDIGHGTSSFSYPVAQQAKKENINFHSISTDIYEWNKINGPVYNMATTLSKFLALGYSLEKVIHSVTEMPAKIINKRDIGVIQKGALADFTFFTIENKEVILEDSIGNEILAEKQIKPYAVMIGGNYYECNTNEIKEGYKC